VQPEDYARRLAKPLKLYILPSWIAAGLFGRTACFSFLGLLLTLQIQLFTPASKVCATLFYLEVLQVKQETWVSVEGRVHAENLWTPSSAMQCMALPQPSGCFHMRLFAHSLVLGAMKGLAAVYLRATKCMPSRALNSL
jgi:hypothetical protein